MALSPKAISLGQDFSSSAPWIWWGCGVAAWPAPATHPCCTHGREVVSGRLSLFVLLKNTWPSSSYSCERLQLCVCWVCPVKAHFTGSELGAPLLFACFWWEAQWQAFKHCLFTVQWNCSSWQSSLFPSLFEGENQMESWNFTGDEAGKALACSWPAPPLRVSHQQTRRVYWCPKRELWCEHRTCSCLKCSLYQKYNHTLSSALVAASVLTGHLV